MSTNGGNVHLFIFTLEVLVNIINQEQEIKGVNIEKEEAKLSLVGDMIEFLKHTRKSTQNITI